MTDELGGGGGLGGGCQTAVESEEGVEGGVGESGGLAGPTAYFSLDL